METDRETETHKHTPDPTHSSINGFPQRLKSGKQGSICTNTQVYLTGINIVCADCNVFCVGLFFNYWLLRAFKKHSNHQDCKVHVCCYCFVYCWVCAVHRIINTFPWSILRLILFTFVQWIMLVLKSSIKTSRKLQVEFQFTGTLRSCSLNMAHCMSVDKIGSHWTQTILELHRVSVWWHT